MTDFAEYKGYKIQVTMKGEFQAIKEGVFYGTTNSLIELHKLLDKLSTFKTGVQVYINRGSSSNYKLAKITSVQQRRWSGGSVEFRVTWKDGNDSPRWDLQARDLVKVTEKNTQLVKEYNEANRLARDQRTLMDKLAQAMETYKEDELVP